MSNYSLQLMKQELRAYNSIRHYQIFNRMCQKLLASDAKIYSRLN